VKGDIVCRSFTVCSL